MQSIEYLGEGEMVNLKTMKKKIRHSKKIFFFSSSLPKFYNSENTQDEK